MVRENEVREAEVTIEAPAAIDAGLVFIGRIGTPWISRLVSPRLRRIDGPVYRIEVFEPWIPALQSLEAYSRVEVLYWLHLSRRDLVLQSPSNDGDARGTFSLRSPARPNPIGTAIALLQRIDGGTVYARGLDCIDETPLLDLKPDRTLFTPIVPPQAGDFRPAMTHRSCPSNPTPDRPLVAITMVLPMIWRSTSASFAQPAPNTSATP